VGLVPRREVGLLVGEAGGGDTREAVGFDRGQGAGERVVGAALLGEGRRSAGEGLGRGPIGGRRGGRRLVEGGKLGAGVGEAARELVGVAQVGGHVAAAFGEHGGGGGVAGVGVGKLARGGARRGVGCGSRRVAGVPQRGNGVAPGQYLGLAGHLALGGRRRRVVGRAADRARGAGAQRARQQCGLAPRPGALEYGELGLGPVGGARGCGHAVVAVGADPVGGVSASRQGLGGRVGGGLGVGEAGRPLSDGGELADAIGELAPQRFVRGRCREGVGGLLTSRGGDVEGDLGGLELEQARCELVAAVVDEAVEGLERLGPAGEVELGPQGLHVGRPCGVGRDLGSSGVELVEARDDGLRRREVGERGLLGGGRPRRSVVGFGDLLGEPCQALAEIVGRRDVGRAQDRVDLGPGVLRGALDHLSLGLERFLHPQVALGAKQALEDVLAVSAARLQQLLEPALRQHDDLAELLAAKAEELDDAAADVGGLGREGPALGVVVVGRCVGAVPQCRRRVLDRDAVAATLGARLEGAALHAVTTVADREIEADLGAQVGRSVGGAHVASLAGTGIGGRAARRVAVEGEDHGVEDGRLAGAGRTVDEEEAVAAESREVEDLAVGVGPESLHDEELGFHEPVRPRGRHVAGRR
jgi:hypothetical protein